MAVDKGEGFRVMIGMIACVASNGVIGKDGKMPWGNGFKDDLAFFKKYTMGKTVVMGRRTYRSLPGGKPLSGIADGRRAVDAILAIYRSAEEDKTVYL